MMHRSDCAEPDCSPLLLTEDTAAQDKEDSV